MANGIAVINGRNYAHQDINTNIGNVPIVSISDISITRTQIKEYSYGSQNLPVGYGIGKKEAPEISFTMSKTDSDKLEFASPNNDSLDLDPFDIPMTGLLPTNPRLKIIKNILITSVEESSDEDTTDIKVTYTGICSHIENKF